QTKAYSPHSSKCDGRRPQPFITARSAAAVSRRILCVIVCGSPQARGRSVQGQAKTILLLLLLLLLTIAACRRRRKRGHARRGRGVAGPLDSEQFRFPPRTSRSACARLRM